MWWTSSKALWRRLWKDVAPGFGADYWEPGRYVEYWVLDGLESGGGAEVTKLVQAPLTREKYLALDSGWFIYYKTKELGVFYAFYFEQVVRNGNE